jgi:DNA-binding response OmpR family regulator
VKQTPVVLTVDSNQRNLELLSEYLNKAGYQDYPAVTLEKFDQALESPQEIDLALVGLAGFDKSIWERCERLRDAHIPFLVLSPRQARTIQQESFARGARGVMIKPVVIRELLAIMGSLLEEYR